jgi:hypothetical protein
MIQCQEDIAIYQTVTNIPARISFYPSSLFLLNKTVFVKLGLLVGDSITIIPSHGNLYIARAKDGDKVKMKVQKAKKGFQGYYNKKVRDEYNMYDKAFLLTDEVCWQNRRMYKLEPIEIRDYRRHK